MDKKHIELLNLIKHFHTVMNHEPNNGGNSQLHLFYGNKSLIESIQSNSLGTIFFYWVSCWEYFGSQ